MAWQQDHPESDHRASVGVCEGGTMPGATLCWPDLTFSRDKVVALGVPAYLWMPDGAFWEFDGGAFWVTAPGDRGARRRVVDQDVPEEGWSHPAGCDCAGCRVTRF